MTIVAVKVLAVPFNIVCEIPRETPKEIWAGSPAPWQELHSLVLSVVVEKDEDCRRKRETNKINNKVKISFVFKYSRLKIR